MTTDLYYFDDDGITPNSPFPVVLFTEVFEGEDLEKRFLATFRENNWTNNWLDSVQTKDHYHTTTHEVLAICKGEVRLRIGGNQGKLFHLKAGDALIIPAGVGHFSVDNSFEYVVAGGYPDGREWDMIYNDADQYEAAKRNIALVPLPTLHPITGKAFIEFQND